MTFTNMKEAGIDNLRRSVENMAAFHVAPPPDLPSYARPLQF